MESPTRSSFTFISNEVSGTVPSKRKLSIKSTDSQKRMVRGANDRNTMSTSKKSNQNSENGTSKAKKCVEQSRTSIQDVHGLDNLRARPGSELAQVYPSTSNSQAREDSLKKRSLDVGPICFCASSATRSTGDKRLDEMMDYAKQNLNEAEKALTNLGDNFENDLKLMFVDIMTRVQHWVSVVQNRIYAARADLESLQKESIARVSDSSVKDLELIELRKKLCEAEAKLAVQEKLRVEVTSDAVGNSGEGKQVEQERVSASVQATTEKDTVKDRDKLEGRTLANIGCQSETDREETVDREVELETEVAQLLEANERMMKERAEYENAIHCALLRGVSSLNVETLRVLRCPPIPCCNSCGLSTPCSDSPESVVLCRPRSTRCDATPQPVQRGSKGVTKNTRNDKIQDKNDGMNSNCCLPLSEHLLYCRGNSEESPENGMVFFLHHGDARNLYQPCAQPRYRPGGTLSNKGTVCAGGKCRKAVTTVTKEKNSCTTRSPTVSRPASNDICVRNRDDIDETGTSKKNTLTAKRCGACTRNRRNRDD